jgi:putative transcriptional regulator
MESLIGNFLVATPQMTDPHFHQQVIYLCGHNTEGAMGLAINAPHPEITLFDILHSQSLAIPDGPMSPVYQGGPLGLDTGFILSSSEILDRYAVKVPPGVYVSRDSRLLEDISLSQGPECFLFILGYTSWGPGQLEAELVANNWLLVPADLDVLFYVPIAQRWKMAAQRFGIDIMALGDTVGRA